MQAFLQMFSGHTDGPAVCGSICKADAREGRQLTLVWSVIVVICVCEAAWALDAPVLNNDVLLEGQTVII